jgi:tRNA U55 pseudouridine synthase TruB
VGSGTYIRSIAYRLGQQLKTWGGIVTQLRRTQVDHWSLEELEKQDQHELSGLTEMKIRWTTYD